MPSVQCVCAFDRNLATCPQVWEDSKWRVRNNLQSETVGVRPSPFWESPACHLQWPVEHPRRPAERRQMCRRRPPRRSTNSSSVRRKFPTSACRPSMCSTRKALRQPKSATSSPGAAAVAVAGVAVADAAGEAAAAVVAAVVADGVGREAVAAPARREFVSATSIDTGRHGRALLDPAGPVSFVIGLPSGRLFRRQPSH
jgi:hypothetical protein